MKVVREDNKVRVSELSNFNLDKIIDSGQCFRWNKLGNKFYEGVVGKNLLRIQKLSDEEYIFYCRIDDFNDIYIDYFDLNRDYNKINKFIIDNSEDEYFTRTATAYSNGIRILKQDKWEMLVTFILSQQNNIPRIKYIIQRLCDELGEIHRDQSGRYYTTFPSAETILEHQACIYNDIGAGFRDKYLIETATRWILSRDRILSTEWDYESILSELKKFYGVGDKIANCVALFGFGFTEAFPMDVWIKRIISNYYEENEFNKDRYGEYAGIVQQYMYYYARLLEDKL